jgi:hypothetical protein
MALAVGASPHFWMTFDPDHMRSFYWQEIICTHDAMRYQINVNAKLQRALARAVSQYSGCMI